MFIALFVGFDKDIRLPGWDGSGHDVVGIEILHDEDAFIATIGCDGIFAW